MFGLWCWSGKRLVGTSNYWCHNVGASRNSETLRYWSVFIEKEWWIVYFIPTHKNFSGVVFEIWYSIVMNDCIMVLFHFMWISEHFRFSFQCLYSLKSSAVTYVSTLNWYRFKLFWFLVMLASGEFWTRCLILHLLWEEEVYIDLELIYLLFL